MQSSSGNAIRSLVAMLDPKFLAFEAPVNATRLWTIFSLLVQSSSKPSRNPGGFWSTIIISFGATDWHLIDWIISPNCFILPYVHITNDKSTLPVGFLGAIVSGYRWSEPNSFAPWSWANLFLIWIRCLIGSACGFRFSLYGCFFFECLWIVLRFLVACCNSLVVSWQTACIWCGNLCLHIDSAVATKLLAQLSIVSAHYA